MKPVIRTFTGRYVNPMDLQPEDLQIESIAHSLALTNRFAGHTRFPISVAQHSVYVSNLLLKYGEYDAFLGLSHDMAEAYLGDVTKWMKHSPEMAPFRACEDRVAEVIYRTLLPRMPSEEELERLDWADRVMVRYEGNKGCGETFIIDNPRYPPLTDDEVRAVGIWYPWTWRESERRFLKRYHQLRKLYV